MEFGKEFYDNFKKYKREHVDVALKLGRKTFTYVLYQAYELNKIPRDSEDVILALQAVRDRIEWGLIFKPKLTSYFSEYPSEDVMTLFNNATNRQKEDLRKRFVVDDTKELREVFPPNDNHVGHNLLYGMGKSLERGDLSKIYVDYAIDIYRIIDPLKKYSIEMIDSVFSTLSDKQKELLNRRLSLGVSNQKSSQEFTFKDTRAFNYIVRIIKERLEKLSNGYVLVGLEDVFELYSMNELKNVIDMRTETKDYYYRVFNQDLNRMYVSLPDNVRSIVSPTFYEKLINNINVTLPPFYSLFEGYQREGETLEEFHSRIDYVCLKYLNPRYKDLLNRAYGENDDDLNRKGINIKEKSFLFCYVITRIKKKLGEEEVVRFYKPFYDSFPMFFSRSEIDMLFNSLLEEEKEILRLKYGRDLSTPARYGDLTIDEARNANFIINKMKKKLFNNKSKSTGISVANLRIIYEMTRTQEYEDLASEYGANIAVAVIGNLYIDSISEKQILNLTGVNARIYLNISREYLEQMKGDNARLALY